MQQTHVKDLTNLQAGYLGAECFNTWLQIASYYVAQVLQSWLYCDNALFQQIGGEMTII